MQNESIQKDRGSITVEAAFVIPIVIFTVFALIYLAFYLHDYCRIQGTMDKVLHKATITIKHDADITTGKVSYETIGSRGVFYLLTGDSNSEKSEILEYLSHELSKGLFITKIQNIQVEVGKLSISASIKAEAQVTLPYFQRLFDQFTSTRINDSCPVHDPAETIRLAEVILDTGSDIKGVNELKDKIDNIMKLK